MLTDALASFVTPGSVLSLVGGAGVAIPSGIIDLIGNGPGTAPGNIIGQRTVFGTDIGIGDPRLQTEVAIQTALATANGATLNVQFQAAPDTGAAGGYAPGAWTTLMETGALPVSSLNAAGKIVARFDFPPATPPNFSPRYLRLNFVPAAGTNFSAGAIAAPSTTVRDDTANFYTPRNFSV